MSYNSEPDTRKHIDRVQSLIFEFVKMLKFRAWDHDNSKLKSPEKEIFDEYTPKLKGSTYGSDEYKEFLKGMGAALEHHYKKNRHHPEHFKYIECNGCFTRYDKDYNGFCKICGYGQFTDRFDIAEMTLLDLIEMLCDWKAATERHADGDINKSLEINQKRFGIDNQLQHILENTAKLF